MSTELGLWIVVGALAVLLGVAIVNGWLSSKGGGGLTSLTSFHDLQPKDKQKAMEVVIEEKSGKRMMGQETGQDKKNDQRESSVE